MSRLFYVLLIFSVLFSSAQFNPEGIKGPVKFSPKIEPPRGELQINNFPVPSYSPRVEGRNNWVTVTLIDSSANGFGMVSGQTKPLSVYEDDRWFLTYRQYSGENTTRSVLNSFCSNFVYPTGIVDFITTKASWFNVNASPTTTFTDLVSK